LVSSEPVLYLKKGREKPLLRGHPWVFSGAVSSLKGDIENGETIKILNSYGEFIGWGAYSAYSQIQARVWSWEKEDEIGLEFFKRRIENAVSARAKFFEGQDTDSLRLVHGESDGLPGLVVDRYGLWVVAQFLSSGPEHWRSEILKSIVEICKPQGVFERSDSDVRHLEGLADQVGLIWGESPPEMVEIREHGLRFWVDLRQGHKTGHYLDQRANRQRVRFLARGRDVLDCFCYTGGFSVNALAGGAQSVIGVDSAAIALRLAKENLDLNHFPGKDYSQIEGDVFQVLRSMRDQQRKFDMIILDPPKFAPTAAHVNKAARGYKDINLLAFKLLKPGGLLVTFSCSGGVEAGLFQKIVAGAALDAQVQAQVIERLHQDVDHPVSLSFPEGEYLKGLVIRIK
jgi:23S rRNA (cytosine1962-C5)-methyltransferase